MELYIDTSDNTKTVIRIDEELATQSTAADHSQNVLGLVSQLLAKKRAKIENITKITVNIGPGSFTGLRVGIAVANTLAWVLRVPVNNRRQVEPKYEEEK